MVVLFCGCALVVSIWVFRSMKNAWLIQRSGKQPKISPGWSIGWYFIPIANLWKPLQTMFEINKSSLKDPSRLTFWIGIWWLFGLSGMVLAISPVFRVLATGVEIDAINCFIYGSAFMLDILAAVFLIKIISGITAAQMELFDFSLPGEQKSPLD